MRSEDRCAFNDNIVSLKKMRLYVLFRGEVDIRKSNKNPYLFLTSFESGSRSRSFLARFDGDQINSMLTIAFFCA